MNTVIKHAIGYTLCYGVIFAVFMQSVAWSWPIPGGDVNLEGVDLILAHIGSFVVSVAAIPFAPTMPFLGKGFWFFVTAIWAGIVYSCLFLVLSFLKNRKCRTGQST